MSGLGLSTKFAAEAGAAVSEFVSSKRPCRKVALLCHTAPRVVFLARPSLFAILSNTGHVQNLHLRDERRSFQLPTCSTESICHYS